MLQVQSRKVANELQSLEALLETFQQISASLQRENLPQTSRTQNKYVSMGEKLRSMSEELSDWSFVYSSAHAPEGCEVNAQVTKAFAVQFRDEALGQKPQDGQEGGGRARRGRRAGRGGGRGGRGGKQGDRERPQKGPKGGKEEKPQKGPKGGKEKADKRPESAQRSSSLPSTDVKWECFMIQKKPNIESVAVTSGNDLLILTNQHLIALKTSPLTKMFEREIQDESIDALAIATSKTDKVDFVVKLDTKTKFMKFMSARGKSNPYDYISRFFPVHQGVHGILATAGHFACYPYTEANNLHVAFVAVDNASPDLVPHGVPVQVPFTSNRVRALCLYISNKGNPVLICANVFQAGSTDKSEDAVIAMTKQIVHWKITFNSVDPEASNFDLRSMATDGANVFVLNCRANAIYHISKNGTLVQKVNIVGGPPKFNLYSPVSVALDARTKTLYVAHAKDVVSKLSYA